MEEQGKESESNEVNSSNSLNNNVDSQANPLTSEKEKRVRAMTRIYYSNPAVKSALLGFASNREVVPRYFEAFGKRPDIIQYNSDIDELVKKGATSFHASEEIWENPLGLNSEMSLKELNAMRKGWDLLIDIDSPFLDYSKIAAKLLIGALESYGINYGIKFSGSKGFHIIISSGAFPEEFRGERTREMFPVWPRAICEFLTNEIRKDYNKEVSKIEIDFNALEKRTKLKKQDLKEVICPECGRTCKAGKIVKFFCRECHGTIERKDIKVTKKRLKCTTLNCPGIYELEEEKDYYYCEYCEKTSWNKTQNSGIVRGGYTKKEKEDFLEDVEETLAANKMGSMDLVLVASRHLFRMPYSLHEKTALSSVVLTKNEIENFVPQMANPMKIKIRNFIPENKIGEAVKLLAHALEWKKERDAEEQAMDEKQFAGKKYARDESFEFKDVDEKMFPPAIKKLLQGLTDGRKRGLFILITFLRSLNFSPEYINKKVREWNEKNEQPLKEGYVKSQIDWHLKQSRKILPPNYNNDAFYKDLNLLDEKPKTKNPIVDVMFKVRDARGK